ncbi:MAG: nucleotidyltransferase domain-containing protein [Phycisphaerales bacterium]
MPDRQAIIDRLAAHAPDLRRRYAVVSIARGDADASSDADILVAFDPAATVTLTTLARLKTELESLLGRGVDLVEDHAALRPAFRAAVERDLLRVA